MRINDSKPLPAGPTMPTEEVAPSKLGEIKPANGAQTTELTQKYTMFDGSAQLAGEATGTMNVSADILQKNLQKTLDEKLSGKNVKWEGPDFDAIKSVNGAFRSTSGIKTETESRSASEGFTSKTLPANDGVVIPGKIEYPNLTSAEGKNSAYQHNQTDLEFIAKKTEPKK